ncbi:MAG: metal ABC transporter substrate-binding protein, partial [Poseidonia sp.]
EHAHDEEDEHAHDEEDEHAHDEEDEHHDEEEGEHHDEEEGEHHDEDEDGHDEDDHDDHGDEEALEFDPHSWLNPMAFAAQIDVVSGVLSTAFPDGADTFKANADAYKAKLTQLDADYEAAFGATGTCSDTTVAANHNAYAYMADAYDLEFVTVHGLDPEGEPSAEDIAEVVERISEDEITVLFVEEFTDASAVESLVQQTVSDAMPNGVQVLTLYTMEMAPMDSNDDYMSLMTKNLENLKAGLGC